MLGAKFGESKKSGFDFIILPPWAKNIHTNRFFLRFLLLETGYKLGNIRSIREVSTKTGSFLPDIEEIAYALMALNSSRSNIPMSPKEIISHLSRLLMAKDILTTPFASKRIVSPNEIKYFRDTRRLQGADFQRLLAIHQLLHRFKVDV